VGRFKVGDKAVYPAHGVGEVTGIETREISGRRNDFYILRILESDMKVMVPTDNATSVGLRGIIPKAEVKKVFEVLRRKTITVAKQTWNRRHREYMEKLKTGSVYEIAEVLRELSLLRVKKDLSYSERKVLETARSLLVQELALARRTKESRIESELDAIFS
jgi:CarD family transcriptional regulator, regulator of rRNA transcription